MKQRLLLFWTDMKSSKMILFLPLVITLMLYVLTTCFMTVLSPEMKAWRFGYLGQEILILVFLLWAYLVLQRWFGKEETESLRSTDPKHTCLINLLLALLLELLILLVGAIAGTFAQINYFGEAFRILIYQAFLTAIIYFLTVLFHGALLPLILTVSYCLFCAVFAGDKGLSYVCLIRPGVGGAVTIRELLLFWPLFLITLVLFLIADRLEKRLVLM